MRLAALADFVGTRVLGGRGVGGAAAAAVVAVVVAESSRRAMTTATPNCRRGLPLSKAFLLSISDDLAGEPGSFSAAAETLAELAGPARCDQPSRQLVKLVEVINATATTTVEVAAAQKDEFHCERQDQPHRGRPSAAADAGARTRGAASGTTRVAGWTDNGARVVPSSGRRRARRRVHHHAQS
jgi:hypothetical protein